MTDKRIEELYEENNYPSAQRLYKILKGKRKILLSISQMRPIFWKESARRLPIF